MIIVEVRIRWHPETGKARLFSIRRVNNAALDIPWKRAIKEEVPEFVEQALKAEWDESSPYPRVLPDISDPRMLLGLFRENHVLISPENGVYLKIRSDGEHYRAPSRRTRSRASSGRNQPGAEHNLTQPNLL